MPTSTSTLIQRVRRFVRDWPDQDSTTASVSSAATTVTVADTTLYTPNWPIQLDSESMIVRALASGTNLTVVRGSYGSTAASHASGASVLINPGYSDMDIVDALNCALDASFPLLYKEVVDESLTAAASTYEYTIPNMSSPAIPIPFLSAISVKDSGDLTYRPKRDWRVLRGSTPKIKFRRDEPSGGTIRLRGFGPFPHLTNSAAETIDAQFPIRGESPLIWYAAQYLLASGEAGRVRFDKGLTDDREQANRAGSSMAASNALYQRFQVMLAGVAMAPLPRHVVSVL